MKEKPNWQEVINQLLQNRTQKELSKITGVPQSTISDMKNGKPKKRLPYDSGIALLKVLEADK